MERTYVFNQDGGTGANNGLLASILPSLQNRGIDTGYLMGLMGGNGNGGFFGNNGGFQDIIALIVIAAIFGNGNFGFGGNNNQGANEGREMIMQTLNRNGVDIAALAQAVNTSSDQILAGINSVSQAICGLGNQMGQNTNSILTAIMQGNSAIATQSIEHDKGYDVAYVANMLKADFYKKSLVDEAHLCKHIKCYLDDIDGDPCRAFDEFFATCIGKGIPVIWSDVI